MKNKTLTATAAVLLALTFHASAEEGNKHNGKMADKASALIERMDQDGDSQVNASEFLSTANLRAQKAFAAMDTDGDGVISAEEFKAASAAKSATSFSRMDRNADGKITIEDFYAMNGKHRMKSPDGKRGAEMHPGKDGKREAQHHRRHHNKAPAPDSSSE